MSGFRDQHGLGVPQSFEIARTFICVLRSRAIRRDTFLGSMYDKGHGVCRKESWHTSGRIWRRHVRPRGIASNICESVTPLLPS